MQSAYERHLQYVHERNVLCPDGVYRPIGSHTVIGLLARPVAERSGYPTTLEGYEEWDERSATAKIHARVDALPIP